MQGAFLHHSGALCPCRGRGLHGFLHGTWSCGHQTSDRMRVACHLHFNIFGGGQHAMVVCDKEGDIIFSKVQFEPFRYWGYGTWRCLHLPWIGLRPFAIAAISSDNVLCSSTSCFVNHFHPDWVHVFGVHCCGFFVILAAAADVDGTVSIGRVCSDHS